MLQDQSRVLLIEQDAAFARYMGEMLGQARDVRTELASAPDLFQGLRALRQGEFDVVLTDLAVPDGAGPLNVSLLRAQAPHLPIIVVGESCDESLAWQVVSAGAHDYLVKSQLTPAWLERSIRYAIERHRMDRTVLEAEEKYHGLFDHLVEGIFQTTPDGRYLMANAALARIYGYGSPDELMASLTDISRLLYVQPGRRDEFVRLMQEQDVISGFESQVFRKDATVIWISENCRGIRDSQGRLLYFEGTVEDITQRKAAESRLRHSEALYHSLVETLPQNIFRKDMECRFTFANQQFCKTLGRTLEEIVGKTDFDFFPAALAEKYQRDDRRVLQTGQPYETVEEHQPPGAPDKIYVQVVKTPLREADGTILGLQAIFWDITQQRMAEEKIRRTNLALMQSRKELRAKNLQMEEDLRMAREIQLTMLPQQYPAFTQPGLPDRDAFLFNHRYIPAGSVGGDFFTISALSETQVGVFLCDVAGHGVRSALVTAMIRALVEELKPCATQPGQFLTKLNNDLCAILRHADSPLLTTAFYLVADWRTGKMAYSNAGHPKPLHVRRRAGQVQTLANDSGTSQPALGLFVDHQFLSSQVDMEPNDMVLLFTDGLIEVENQHEDLYSQAMLVAAIERRIQQPAARLLDELLAEVRCFSGETVFPDDVCLVTIEAAPRP